MEKKVRNIFKLSEYERGISINLSDYELGSERYEINKRWIEKRDNKLDCLINQGESSKNNGFPNFVYKNEGLSYWQER